MTNSNTESSKSTTGNSQSPKSPNDSTGQTSLNSKFQASSSGNVYKDAHMGSSERKPHAYSTSINLANCRNHDPHSSPDSNLTTIQENVLDQTIPSVLTVERAAAAKVFLETYFNERLAPGPTPRSVRLRSLETQIFSRGLDTFSPEQLDSIRAQFYKRETDHLRETRVLRARSIRALAAPRGSPNACLVNDYEVVKILGRGSFGVVRLVRERQRRTGEPKPGDGWSEGERKQVYAMKVIRKRAMLRTCQEGHLRAERDFLVASEGSRWIVPLIASFQDATNLYLVMEYMPGGDFLGLLIRENVLPEGIARFYVAEMILCVEAAHALRCIHRDIKPDNFLISASGHLKISDFGLAFDGHWSHDTSYYSSHRYSLIKKLGINIEGNDQDQKEGRSLQATVKWTSGIMIGLEKHDKKNYDDGEPLLNWRNRCGNRTAAMSVVGTSQYMAPEVVEGKKYDARSSLIQDKENRLCSKRYQFKDLVTASSSLSTWGISSGPSGNPRSSSQKQQSKGPRDFTGRYVFPYDAEDIKSHKWFRGVPWERLHQAIPPHIPRLRAVDDTHYFDEDYEISDWSESESSESEQGPEVAVGDKQALHKEAILISPPSGGLEPVAEMATAGESRLRERENETRLTLMGFHRSVQKWALAAIAAPYDNARLRNFDIEIEGFAELSQTDRDKLRRFIRVFGRKERKRPRDKLLRDRSTRAVVMEVREKTAFLGYTWRRMRPDDLDDPEEEELGREENMATNADTRHVTAARARNQDECAVVGLDGGVMRGYGGFGGWGDDVVALKALHKGRLSLH
ncbi:hypothetical protein OQA88_4095 [Cercophora sp. LCS_1]